MSHKFNLAISAAAMVCLAAPPAAAQGFSDGYLFLKAVKDRDGGKTQELIAKTTTLINTKDYGSGEGALHILVRGRDLAWLRFLLSRGARADIQENKEGDTPLILATQLGWQDGAEALILNGAKVDLGNSRGETPLILAVQKRDVGMVRMLVERGADPRRQDRIAGYSALDYARQDSRSSQLVTILEAAKPAKPVSGPKL